MPKIPEETDHTTTYEIPASLIMLYRDEHGHPNEAGRYYERGLCPHLKGGEFCGKDRDERSRLGHCTRHYSLSGD